MQQLNYFSQGASISSRRRAKELSLVVLLKNWIQIEFCRRSRLLVSIPLSVPEQKRLEQ